MFDNLIRVFKKNYNDLKVKIIPFGVHKENFYEKRLDRDDLALRRILIES